MGLLPLAVVLNSSLLWRLLILMLLLNCTLIVFLVFSSFLGVLDVVVGAVFLVVGAVLGVGARFLAFDLVGYLIVLAVACTSCLFCMIMSFILAIIDVL